jgi:excisionase family DNA binding protein
MRKTFMSAAEAAGLLGVSRERARQLAASGEIEAIRTTAGWMLDADEVSAAAAAARIRRESPHGRVSAATAAKMAPYLSEAERDALDLLTGDPAPARASRARDEDDELPVETCALYPPGTFGPETDRRVARAVRAAAAARDDLDESELYALLWPPEER